MTCKLNADTSDGLKIVSDTSGEIDIQSNGTTSINFSPSQITITDADSNQPRLLLKNTNADSSPPFLDFQKDSASPADNDVIGKMRFIGDDDGGNTVAYATIVSTSPDVSDGSENGDLRFETTVDGTNAERMRIDSSGTVFMGQTTNPATSTLVLKVSTGSANGVNAQITSNTGTSFAWSNYNASGSYVGGITCTSSSTAFPTSSDYRLKENVDYTFDATSRLKQLKPCRFNFIADTDNTVDGFLAHEVSSIVPEAIFGEKDAMETYTDDDGNEQTRISPQSIDQSKLVPLLVKTIQELEARITALENN
jgi:hypothetical protein